MRKLFSSVTIGLVLLLTVVLPSLVFMVFQTSSMAAGVMLVLGLHIFLFAALSAIRPQSQSLGVGALLITAVGGGVVIQGGINLLMNNNFDLTRFLLTYLFLIIYLLGAFFFALLVQKVPEFQADFAVKLVFYVLLLSSIASILHFSPFSSEQIKPVFFFNEPSHFALGFLPFLLYMTITSSTRMKLLLVLFSCAVALLLENLTLVVGCTFVAVLVIPMRQWLFLMSIASIIILFTTTNIDYYSLRVDPSSDNQNLSTLVYLSGWERSYLNFEETFGLGVGFQQFGIIGSRGEIMQSIGELGAEDLNLLDGGAVAPKFIGEFGLLGVVMLFAYLVYFAKSAKWLREVSLGGIPAPACRRVFFLSCFVIYCIDLFVRGTGYFSSSGFLFISSLMWIILVKPTNDFGLKILDVGKTEP